MSRPVPIAIFLSTFQPGGTERQTIELIRRLNRDRFEVHAVCFEASGAWLPRAQECAASIEAFPIHGFRRPATFAQARAFARWCRARDIKIVYTADFYTNVFALPAAAAAGVPVRLGSRREINAGKRPAQLALQRAAYACAHAVVANCAAAAHRLAAERVPSSRVIVIPNGVDVAQYVPRTEPRPIRRIAMVANLRPEKAHEVLFAAMQMVLRRVPDAELIVAGDGPRRAELEGMAAAMEIAARVRFLGHCEDVPALLAACDAFVLPSVSEAFPNSVLEAMASGLPIVASRIGGIVELIEHQRTGVLVPPGDARALAYALLDLIQWRTHAHGLGLAARRTVEARCSFDRMVAAFERLYLEQLARRALGAPAASEVVAS
ncbi:MAG TPA: glycosyltransferase family 4 protein [Vicinamibacterales bacterium]|nr:glycosyltransferase family 4 protein [Vicinamibacterales bacterium]